jgi:hypothetical protein
MDNKMGIDNIQKFILLILSMANAFDFIGRHTEIGVARFAKLTESFDEVMAMGSFKIADFKAECSELNEEEKAKLKALIKEKFDIEDDMLETKIEEALDLFTEGYTFITKVISFTKTMKV